MVVWIQSSVQCQVIECCSECMYPHLHMWPIKLTKKTYYIERSTCTSTSETDYYSYDPRCFSFVWSNFFWLIYMDRHVVTTSHVGVVDSELVDTTCSCLYAFVYMPSTYHRIEIKHLRGEVGHWRIVSLQQLDCTREGLCVFHKLYSQWAALAFIVLIRVLSYDHYPVTPVIRWKGCSWSF